MYTSLICQLVQIPVQIILLLGLQVIISFLFFFVAERLHNPRRRVVVCGDSLGGADARFRAAVVVAKRRAGGC